MTKHPFYNPTPQLIKELCKGLFKTLLLFAVILGVGFVCRLLVSLYPQLAAFTYIHEYTNVIQASILCFTLLMTYLVAYALPIFVAVSAVYIVVIDKLSERRYTAKYPISKYQPIKNNRS